GGDRAGTPDRIGLHTTASSPCRSCHARARPGPCPPPLPVPVAGTAPEARHAATAGPRDTWRRISHRCPEATQPPARARRQPTPCPAAWTRIPASPPPVIPGHSAVGEPHVENGAPRA